MAKRQGRIERLEGQLAGKGFKVDEVQFYGLPAYIIDKLIETGLYGTTRAQVAEELAKLQIRKDLKFYEEAFGFNIGKARKECYWPIKFK